jgi:prevent-host-death family protein
VTNQNVSSLCPSQDVRPVTEFRAHTSAFLEQIRATKRAVILTQHGRSAAVLLDVAVYEDLLGELAQLRERVDPEPSPPPAADTGTPKSLAEQLRSRPLA